MIPLQTGYRGQYTQIYSASISLNFLSQNYSHLVPILLKTVQSWLKCFDNSSFNTISFHSEWEIRSYRYALFDEFQNILAFQL